MGLYDKYDVYKVLFDPTLKFSESYAGFDDYNGKSYDIALCKEFYILRNHSDSYSYEYAFNYDGEFCGVREEITISGIENNYWIILYADVSGSRSVLFYKTPDGLKEIFVFPEPISVYPERTKDNPGNLRDKEKHLVIWYDGNRRKAAWFFPDGTMKKGRKKAPSNRQLQKKMKDMKAKGII